MPKLQIDKLLHIPFQELVEEVDVMFVISFSPPASTFKKLWYLKADSREFPFELNRNLEMKLDAIQLFWG